MPQFEAAGAQVLGVSADHIATLDAFAKQNPMKQVLASDFRRTMLPAYDALVTDEKSPIYRYAKRAYFVVDSQGVVRYVKVMDNPLDLLQPEDLLKALKDSKAS
jgi:peroxiredoxin